MLFALLNIFGLVTYTLYSRGSLVLFEKTIHCGVKYILITWLLQQGWQHTSVKTSSY